MTLPNIELAHLRALSDQTGILQHARYGVPDRDHGYCTDDNARALIVVCRHYEHTGDAESAQLAAVYLSFLQHAFNATSGRFRNFMSYDRRWLEEVGSEDSHGRALLALAIASASAPLEGERHLARALFADALLAAGAVDAPRAKALILLACVEYLQSVAASEMASAIVAEFSTDLHERFRRVAGDGWSWCEDILTYANARLPHALLQGGAWLGDATMVETALGALAWLDEVQTGRDGCLSIIGCNGWYERGGTRALYDQQPIDAMTTLEAACDAFALTAEERYRTMAERALAWFLGRNDIGVPLVDLSTGACHDGLHPDGVNLNQGAESTLAWLAALLRMHRAVREPREYRLLRSSASGFSPNMTSVMWRDSQEG